MRNVLSSTALHFVDVLWLIWLYFEINPFSAAVLWAVHPFQTHLFKIIFWNIICGSMARWGWNIMGSIPSAIVFLNWPNPFQPCYSPGVHSPYNRNEYLIMSQEWRAQSVQCVRLPATICETLVRFEVSTAVTVKNAIFRDVMPCGSYKNWYFDACCVRASC
jgi:hypothetical protein